MSADGLYLGTNLDGGGRVVLDADHLTTHAVCVGMTGSGKTGLGIVPREALARPATPLLVGELLGVLERQIEEDSLHRSQQPVSSRGEALGRDLPRVAVEGKVMDV